MIGNDARQPVLMAARKNNCDHMECHTSETWADGVFKGEKEQEKLAGTKIMVCTFRWKQHVGHLGNKIRVMEVHGHHHTMNMKLSNDKTNKWWDKLKETID